MPADTPVTITEAVAALVAECPVALPAASHEPGKQRHVHFEGGRGPVRCHAMSFIRSLPGDAPFVNSDAQRALDAARDREMLP